MKYLSTILYGILFVVAASPWLVAFVDLYWNFFNSHTLTGLTYVGSEGFIRCISMCIAFIPTFFFGHLFWFALEELK